MRIGGFLSVASLPLIVKAVVVLGDNQRIRCHSPGVVAVRHRERVESPRPLHCHSEGYGGIRIGICISSVHLDGCLVGGANLDQEP